MYVRDVKPGGWTCHAVWGTRRYRCGPPGLNVLILITTKLFFKKREATFF